MLKYLNSTANKEIAYQGAKNLMEVCAYSDADWASSTNNRKSVSGINVMINNSPVIIKSEDQRGVALSNAKSEYIALSLCSQEVIWLENVLQVSLY